jgi:hypothetical protein
MATRLSFSANDVYRRRYLPDFYVETNDYKYVEEIKGWVDDEYVFKIKCESALIYFKDLNIDFKLNFMRSEKRKIDIITWFNNKKEEINGKK